MLDQVKNRPYVPHHWGINKAGMQATAEAEGELRDVADKTWRNMAKSVAGYCEALCGETSVTADGHPWTITDAMDGWQPYTLDLHKQLVNKAMIPYLWCPVLFTGTRFANFLTLRVDKAADQGMQILGELVADVLVESEPETLPVGEWHVPFVGRERESEIVEFVADDNLRGGGLTYTSCRLRASAAACARHSVKTFDGEMSLAKDMELFDKLVNARPVHASPTEHQAMASKSAAVYSGNLHGWRQFRKTIALETAREFHWKGRVIV
jgi:hypothetical protein